MPATWQTNGIRRRHRGGGPRRGRRQGRLLQMRRNRLARYGAACTASGGTQMAMPAAFFWVVGMPTLSPPAL